MRETTAFSADALFKMLYQLFGQVPEHRPMNVEISLADALVSGFALFSLKDPSLLAFDERRAKPENLRRLYQLQDIPSDTQMRTILDEVDPQYLPFRLCNCSIPCGAKKCCAGCAVWGTITCFRWMAAAM